MVQNNVYIFQCKNINPYTKRVEVPTLVISAQLLINSCTRVTLSGRYQKRSLVSLFEFSWFDDCINGLYNWCSHQKYKNKLLLKNYGYFVKQKQNIIRRMGGAIATSPLPSQGPAVTTIILFWHNK